MGFVLPPGQRSERLVQGRIPRGRCSANQVEEIQNREIGQGVEQHAASIREFRSTGRLLRRQSTVSVHNEA